MVEPFTIFAILLGLAAGGAAIAILSWSQVDVFVSSNSVRSGTAKIIKRKLDSGEYAVVAGVFDSRGSRIAEESWKASTIDNQLQSRFGNRDEITIVT